MCIDAAGVLMLFTKGLLQGLVVSASVSKCR